MNGTVDFLVGKPSPSSEGVGQMLLELTEASVLPQGREERRRAPLENINDWREP